MADHEADKENLRYDFDWDPGDLDAHLPKKKDFFTRTLEGFIDAHIPGGPGECLEVGCFPGRFLTLFGERGYALSGIDFAKGLERVPVWLQSLGYDVGSFPKADFMTHDFGRRFDVVYSLGVVEHLTNWNEAIVRHAALVKPGGHLMIGAPNFSGLLQRVLHRYLDLPSYVTHYIPSMSAAAWAKILARIGFEILLEGTPYPFMFNIHHGYAQGDPAKKAVLEAVVSVAEDMQGTPGLNSIHSSYYHLVIARAPQDVDVDAATRQPSFAPFVAEVVAETLEFDRRVDATADKILAAIGSCAATLSRTNPRLEIGAGFDLSDALMVLCHPFLGAGKIKAGEMELLANMAVAAWNASFLPQDAAEQFVGRIVASLAGEDGASKQRFAANVIRTMMSLKKRYFPRVAHIVRAHSLKRDGEHWRIEATV